MRILFISLSPLENNHSVSISNYSLIKGLVELGHSIDVYTPKWTRKDPSNNDIAPLEEAGVRFYRIENAGDTVKTVQTQSRILKPLLAKIKTLVKKIIRYNPEGQLLNAVSINDLPEKHYDVVITTSDPKESHKVFYKLKEEGLSCERWIQHWGDPLYLDITKNYSKEEGKKVKAKEAALLAGADKIVYVSPLTYEAQKNLYPQHKHKMAFLPLPYSEEINFPAKPSGSFTAGYFGSYDSHVRDILPLYDCCQDSDVLSLIIAGSSDLALKDQSNIKIYDRISQKKVKELQAECDCLVSVLNLHGTQIPGKIYYDSASNKDILIVLDGENSEIIRSYFEPYKRYYFAENKAEDIERALLKIKAEQGQVIKAEALPDFSCRNIAEKLLK